MNVQPGAHLLVIGGQDGEGIHARVQGKQVRDSFLLLLPRQRVAVAFLLREPFDGAVTECLVTAGNGGLHIDPCRVSANLSEFYSKTTGKPRSGLGHAKGFGMGEGYGGANANPPHTLGRWPTNLLLVHDSTCEREGTTKVPGHKGYPNGPGGKSMQYTSDKRGSEVRTGAWAGHADAEGLEEVPIWRCVAGCPVLTLDTMSGERPSTLAGRGTGKAPNPASARPDAFLGCLVGGLSYVYADTGGASRFYPQFASFRDALAWLGQLTTAAGAPLRSC